MSSTFSLRKVQESLPPRSVSWEQGHQLPSVITTEGVAVPFDTQATTSFIAEEVDDFPTVLACTDGSFDLASRSGKFGFLVVSKWLEQNYMRFHSSQCPRDADVVTLIMQHHEQLIFRVAGLPAGGASSSTDTEMRAAHLLTLSCPLNVRIQVWTDSENTVTTIAAVAEPHHDIITATRKLETQAVARAIYCENRKFDRLANSPGRRMVAEWVKGHSPDASLRAVGNRMIDALLRHCPLNVEGAAPSLLEGEQFPGYALFSNGQHVLGCHRKAFKQEQFAQLQLYWQQSPSQGGLLRSYPEDVHNLVRHTRKLAKQPQFRELPSLLVRILTSTLPYLCHFPGQAPDNCFLCGNADETTTSHLFVCPHSAAAAHPFHLKAATVMHRLTPPHIRFHISPSNVLQRLWVSCPRPARAPPWPPPTDAHFIALHLGIFPAQSLLLLCGELNIPLWRV